MKLLNLIAIIITICISSSIVNAQEGPILYANFIPYGSNSDCSGNVTGVGFSLMASGNCYSDIAHNEYSSGNTNYEGEDGYGTLNNYSNEWLIIVDALRVGVAEFETNNKTCTGAFVSTQSIKNGSCIVTPNFMRYNGTVNGYPLSQQYSIVTISKQPYFIPNTQVYSQYMDSGDNGCSAPTSSSLSLSSSDSSTTDSTLLYTMYSTAGLKFISNTTVGEEYVIQCSPNGEASIYTCKDASNCQTIDITLPCTPSDTSFNEIYCTSPTSSK